MVNQIVLVGRIARAPEPKVTENGKKYATLTLAVPRNYKNVSEYCNTGDMIGVKGRVQTRIIESPDGVKRKKTEIVAEKVTFLTSNPNRKKDTIEDSSLEEEE